MKKRTTVGMTLAASVIAVALLVGPGAASAGGKRNCNIDGRQTQMGASYVTSVKAKRTSCRKAVRVVKAFHSCRKRSGGADGRCKGRVKGFKCSERREGVPNIQYNAKVKCKKGAKRVWSTYTQNV